MRVIKGHQTPAPTAASPATRSGFRRLRAPSRSARGAFGFADIELFGLAAATFVVIAGLLLAYAGRAARIDEGAPAQPVIALHELAGPAALEPLLTMYPSAAERQVVAERLDQVALVGVSNSSGPLVNSTTVGGLASTWVAK